MSAGLSADEPKILIAQAQALLENAEYLQGTTPPKTRRDSDTNQETRDLREIIRRRRWSSACRYGIGYLRPQLERRTALTIRIL